MDLENIMLSEISQRKTNTVYYLYTTYMWNLKNNIWVGQKSSFGFSITSYGKTQMNFLANTIQTNIYRKMRNRLTDIENKLVVTRGERKGRRGKSG